MANSEQKSGDDFLRELKKAVSGLLFPSESDKPVKAFLWKRSKGQGGNGASVDSPATLEAQFRAMSHVPSGATIQTISVDEFFAPVTLEQDWFGNEEKARAKQFRELVVALEAGLTDRVVFRVSGAHDDSSLVDVYVVGKTNLGDLAGVSTQLVET